VCIHALVKETADIMGEVVLAMRHGLTLERFAAAIHPHLILTDAMRAAKMVHPGERRR
jgi:pyruvate/2-oxoglutarate dehydrogenase complex dihydrolipoamide dehydrogenase (E3) component